MKLGVSQSSVQSGATNIIPCLGRESYTTVAVSPSSPTWGQGAVLGGRTWQQACGFGSESLVGMGVEVRAGRWRRRWGRGGCGGGRVLGETVLKTVVVPQPFVILRCSSSPWTRLVTCPCWQVWGPRQSTEAFGGISYDFYVNADRFKLILGSASVHGRFWMNFLGFLRAVRGQGC